MRLLPPTCGQRDEGTLEDAPLEQIEAVVGSAQGFQLVDDLAQMGARSPEYAYTALRPSRASSRARSSPLARAMLNAAESLAQGAVELETVGGDHRRPREQVDLAAGVADLAGHPQPALQVRLARRQGPAEADEDVTTQLSLDEHLSATRAHRPRQGQSLREVVEGGGELLESHARAATVEQDPRDELVVIDPTGRLDRAPEEVLGVCRREDRRSPFARVQPVPGSGRPVAQSRVVARGDLGAGPEERGRASVVRRTQRLRRTEIDGLLHEVVGELVARRPPWSGAGPRPAARRPAPR